MKGIDQFYPSFWIYEDKLNNWAKKQIVEYEHYIRNIYVRLYNENYAICIAEEMLEEDKTISYKYGVFINE